MSKKKTYKKKTKETVVKEPLVSYATSRITFSTVETQNDIQLKHSISISPIERLKIMRVLNNYAFKNFIPEQILKNNTRLIFTSYEYLPR